MKTVVIAYLSLLLITFLQVVIGSKIGNQIARDLLIPFLSVCSIVFIVWVSKDRTWVEKELYNRQGWWRVLFGIVASFMAVGLFHLFWNTIASSYGYSPIIFQLKETKVIVTLIIHLSFYCLIEELLFRGYFQEEVKKMLKHLPLDLSLFYQILIPTLMFAVMHSFKMGLGCLLIIVPSLCFGLLKHHSNNIYSAVGAHLVFNLYYSMLVKAPF